MSQPVTLDVRTISPRERHPLIFQKLGELPASGVLELTNDHDPKPLYYQIMAEFPDQFDWEYVESGPEVWQVRIIRKG